MCFTNVFSKLLFSFWDWCNAFHIYSFDTPLAKLIYNWANFGNNHMTRRSQKNLIKIFITISNDNHSKLYLSLANNQDLQCNRSDYQVEENDSNP